MRSEITPEGSDRFRSPLFINPLPFRYEVSYQVNLRKKKTLKYSSPHEIILNLHAFKDYDHVIYINKEDNQEFFRIPVGQFKVMVAEQLYQSTDDKLELLYLRLYLTNRYSKNIIDKGIFLQYDHHLKDFLTKIRGGIDCYLTLKNLQEILYFKYRRYSCIHLLAVLNKWNNENYIHCNHINIPKQIPLINQGLLYESLRLMLNRKSFRLYSYDPVEEDNILETKIDSEIIAVINKLIL